MAHTRIGGGGEVGEVGEGGEGGGDAEGGVFSSSTLLWVVAVVALLPLPLPPLVPPTNIGNSMRRAREHTCSSDNNRMYKCRVRAAKR